MRRVLILISSFISFQLLSCENIISDQQEYKKIDFSPAEKLVLNSSNKFGFNLFCEINKTEPDKNVFISPLSISLALGMTMNGANGETYDAMRATLQFEGLINEEINKSYKNLIETLYAADPKVTFTSANSIWHREEMEFEKKFFNLCKEYFNASVNPLNFSNPSSVDIINNWVKEKTNDKIQKIIEAIKSDDVMFLINAIYFKGTWKYEFDKKQTKKDDFNLLTGEKIIADLMVQKNDFNYSENDELQAIELLYGDGNFSMVVLLPKENININDFAIQLTEEKLNSILSSITIQKGTLWLPKFKTEYKSTLNDFLNSLGMGIAFTPGEADFTNMFKTKELFINSVLHKTFVNVDEEGTEAAAVTSVGMGTTSVGGDKEFAMKVNRPFLFLIREKNSSSVLFIGKIMNPLT